MDTNYKSALSLLCTGEEFLGIADILRPYRAGSWQWPWAAKVHRGILFTAPLRHKNWQNFDAPGQ
jgi:hypothetical protein